MDWQDIPPIVGIKNPEFPVLIQQPTPILISENFAVLENQEYNHDKALVMLKKNLRIFCKALYLYKFWLGAHTL